VRAGPKARPQDDSVADIEWLNHFTWVQVKRTCHVGEIVHEVYPPL